MPAEQTRSLLRWLHDRGSEQPDVAGGKGATLTALTRAGFPVPSGFVVTTAAYRDLVDSTEIRDAIERVDAIAPDDTESLTAAAADLRSRIESAELDPSVTRAITEALASIEDADSFAVRSSATAEDLPTASFAGQHETYLGVPSDGVPTRVRDCMASLFTDRAVAYRARNGISQTDAEMAVVVQPMVDATAAGVLFTADPATGNRGVSLVTANFGLGESIVAGEVTPDQARIDTQSGEVTEYSIGSKASAVELVKEIGNDDDVQMESTDSPRADPTGATATQGTTQVSLSTEQRRSRVLSDEQLHTLVDLGQRAVSELGAPQDIEWALVDDELLLLQSRPITSLFPVPSPAPDDERLHVYVSMGHMQAMPEAMPPLVRDVWRTYTDNALAEFGFDSYTGTITVEAGGRVYMDATPLLRRPRLRSWVIERSGAISKPVSAGLEEIVSRRPDAFESPGFSVGRLPQYLQTVGRTARLVAPAVPPIIKNLLGTVVSRGRGPDESVWTEMGEVFVGNVRDAQTPEARARAVFEAIDIRRILYDGYPRISPLFLAFALGGWLQRRFPDQPEDVNAVGRGFERDVVTRINLGLGDLADVAREHPAVADALRDGASLEEIQDVAGGDVFLTELDAFLDEFGHRGTNEIDLSRPRWREEPAVLLGVVRANLQNDAGGEHHEHVARLIDEADAAAARLEASAGQGPLGPLRRVSVRWLIRQYRETVYFREYPKQEAARAFAAWRSALLEAGRMLANDGILARPDDVWFLYSEELLAVLDDEPIAVDIDSRRREHERNGELAAPAVLTSEGEELRGAVEDGPTPEGTLRGTGVSSGVVEGVARVIRDPATATVEAGEVLVAPSTDPGWTPLFLNAAGLVSEVGGPVSHGALVAREYGLPAVVSVPGATTRIRTGQRIRIDGTRGTVELLDGDDPDDR